VLHINEELKKHFFVEKRGGKSDKFEEDLESIKFFEETTVK
jgi:hypothetical protein